MKKLNTEDIVNIATEYLSARDDIIFAYLFGSYANDKHTHLSDIDIAVYVKDDGHTHDKKLGILNGMSKLLGSDSIDLVILNQSPISLLSKILANKIILVDHDPPIRHAFESLNMRMGFDFSFLEKRILEQRFLHG